VTHDNKPALGVEVQLLDTMRSLQSVKDAVLVGDGALVLGKGTCAREGVQRLGRHLRLEKVVGHEVEEEPTITIGQLVERLRHFARGKDRHTQSCDHLSRVEPVESVYHMVLQIVCGVVKVVLRLVDARHVINEGQEQAHAIRDRHANHKIALMDMVP